MSIQQMMIGGSAPVIPLSVGTTGNPNATVFLTEPAPATTPVTSGVVTAVGVGGTGSYTYSWAYLSGDATIAPVGGTTSAAIQWSATVSKNSTKTATWRVTADDGATTATTDVSTNLTYTASL